MTEQELKEIEARANAATPGRWKIQRDSTGNLCGIIQTNHVTRDVWPIPRTQDDIRFIACARQDVPALIAEVRRLREDRDYYERTVEELSEQLGGLK